MVRCSRTKPKDVKRYLASTDLPRDRRVIALLKITRQLLADVLWFAIVALRPTRVVAAENLFLRRQLALYVERGVKPCRPDVATRASDGNGNLGFPRFSGRFA